MQDAKRVAASAIYTSQNTDLGALQAKVISYEGKIRMLVDTVKTERASFQKQLAEAKAATASNPSPSLLAPPAGVSREGSQGATGGTMLFALFALFLDNITLMFAY